MAACVDTSKRLAVFNGAGFVDSAGLAVAAGCADSVFGGTSFVVVFDLARASACAALVAASISAFAFSRAFFIWRCEPTKPTMVEDNSASSSSAVPVTLRGVVRASWSPSLSFFGTIFTRI